MSLQVFVGAGHARDWACAELLNLDIFQNQTALT
jgi:hypothetical protein